MIPLENTTSQKLNTTTILELRLDYLLHTAMILVFAGIWVWGKIMGASWFVRRDAFKYSIVVMIAGFGLEFIQLIVPWRTFNPMDMVFNLSGAILTILFIYISKTMIRNTPLDPQK